MPENIERNLGQQPIVKIMAEHDLKPHSLVEVSTLQITHKMVTRAMKGRRLTVNVQSKIRDALNQATGGNYSRSDLFNY